MKKNIYIILLFVIALGCSAKREIVKEDEKRDVVETIDLSSIKQSSLIIKHLLNNSTISIEYIPLSDNATYKSDSAGVQTKGMKVKFNVQKDVSIITTQKDTTHNNTESTQLEDKTVIKKKNKKVDRKQPTLLYIAIILALVLAILAYLRLNHVTLK